MSASEMSKESAAGDPLRASLQSQHPNFDWLRIIAATAVLFSHSFLLAEGTEANEPFRALTGYILGIFGVCVFFVISGFLITRSAFNHSSLRGFAAARALRIYPALAVCAALTSLVIGIGFTSLEPARFISDLIPLKYTIKTVLYPGWADGVPSVQFYVDKEEMGRTFNGSLWSIPQELACYVIIGLLFALRLLRWPVIAVIAFLTLPIIGPWSRDTAPAPFGDFLWVASSFFAGSLIFFIWLRKARLPAWPLLICGALLAVAVANDWIYDLFPLYGAYPLLMLATARRFPLPDLKRFGDISYGMYLYGWPVQQTILALAGGVGAISWHALFSVSALVAAMLGYASWHLLEKRALKWKQLLVPRRVREAALEAG